jgi:hypothetical protein
MYPFTCPLSGSLSIVLVRNPLDVIMSLFSLALTLTHNRTIGNDIQAEFGEEWDWAIKKYVALWNQFYQFYID